MKVRIGLLIAFLCALIAPSAIAQRPASNGSAASTPVHFTQSGTGITALNFTTCLQSGYNDYDVTYTVQLLSSGTLGFQFSTNGGSSYDVTATDYLQFRSYGTLGSSGGSGGSTGLNWDLAGSSGGTNSAQYFSGTFRIYSVNSTATYKQAAGHGLYYGATGTAVGFFVASQYNSTSALNAFRLFSSATSGFTGTVTCTPVVQ